MRHGIDHKRLGRGTQHRMGMLTNMATSLIKHGRIETTVVRAKELKRIVEKLVTRAKEDTVHNRRLARRDLRNEEGVKLLFDVAPRFKGRAGGYTRVLKKAKVRTGDSAEMAIIEFVDYVLPAKKSKDEKKKEREAKKSEKDLEKEAVAAGKPAAPKSTSSKKDGNKKATGTSAAGAKKSTTVRKISSSS